MEDWSARAPGKTGKVVMRFNHMDVSFVKILDPTFPKPQKKKEYPPTTNMCTDPCRKTTFLLLVGGSLKKGRHADLAISANLRIQAPQGEADGQHVLFYAYGPMFRGHSACAKCLFDRLGI